MPKLDSSSAIDTSENWRRLTLEEIAQCSNHVVTVDIETTGLEWWKCNLIGVGVWCPELDIKGYYPALTPQERRDVKAVIGDWGSDTVFIAHNAKFELHFLDIDPFEKGWQIYDTQVMIHLLDSRHKKYLIVVEKIVLQTATKKAFYDKAPYGKQKKIWEWPLNLVAQYCINDCRIEHEIFERLKPRIEYWGLWKLFLKEMMYLKVIWRSEHLGIHTDYDFLVHAMKAIRADMESLEEELQDSVGYKFNWRSHKQLSKALWEGMGILKPRNPYADADGVDRSKFADKGMYNSTMTSTFILEKAGHPLSTLISQLRESKTLVNTLKKYLELRDEQGRLHPDFRLIGTRTGRLSCSKPNLQNVASSVRTRHLQSKFGAGDGAIRTEDYNLRQAFHAPPGFKFVSVDWSQMEIRMFGLLSGDPHMMESLAAGRDVHGDTAERIWKQRDKAHREWAKTISFGLIYGMTAGSLTHRLGVTIGEAKKIQNDYFKAFPTIQKWLKECIQECKENGYVRYWSGRLWWEEDPEKMYRAANALIQGGCADLLSVTAIRLNKWLLENVPEGWIVNYIHDELLVAVPEEAVPMTIKAMEEIMSIPELFGLPWKLSTAVGDTYGTLVDISGSEY